MKQELFAHKLAYFMLISGLVIALMSFLAVWPNRHLQQIVVVAVSLYYVLWGVVTHVHAERISRRIIMEYVMVAVLGGGMLLLITL
jgi:hypothetical protein